MNEPNKIPEMLSIRETAALSDPPLPVHFVRVCVARGDVVSVKAGRKILINVDSFRRYLETGIPQGTPPKAAPCVENVPHVTPISLR